MLTGLTKKVFRWFPTEQIPFETAIGRNSGGWVARYADYRDASFQTEPGVRVRAQLLTAKEPGAPLLLHVKRPDDSIYFMDYDELLPLLGRYTVLVLNPRFTETAISAAEYRDIQMTAAWTGRTIAAMQVWDIMRALEWALAEQKLAPSSVSIYGKGEMGILGLYAALFDSRVNQLILNDPPATHWQGPALLNVLRLTDLAEVAGTFAPRRLISLSRLPEDYQFTRIIYRLERASPAFIEKKSLPEALEVWRYPDRRSRQSPGGTSR